MEKLTPMMQQYKSLKEKYPDTILFFRLGDFYEMFFDDAILVSKELEITLTKRDAGMATKAPMCGVPHHVSDTYIGRLVDKGYKVAICDQLEDPSKAKGIVKRGITRIVTPGTFYDAERSNSKYNNFLCSVFFSDYGFGLSYVDISTGELKSTEFATVSTEKILIAELIKIKPSELIINKEALNNNAINKFLKSNPQILLNCYNERDYKNLFLENGSMLLNKERLENILSNDSFESLALVKLLNYLNETQMGTIGILKSLTRYEIEDYMILDVNTLLNFEINSNSKNEKSNNTLLSVLDKTSTAMGSRLMKQYLSSPLRNKDKIIFRLNCVNEFYSNPIALDVVSKKLSYIYDLERILNRVLNKNIAPKDLILLKKSLENIPTIINECNKLEYIKDLMKSLKYDDYVYKLIDISICDECGGFSVDDSTIREGFNEDLDKIRSLKRDSKKLISNLEMSEREKTGIKNLKIKYNKILGYYFEVTKSNLNQVPEYYIRRQTLVGSERYVSDELKNLETDILSSSERLLQLSKDIFTDIVNKVYEHYGYLLNISEFVSKLDVICSFARCAHINNYVKPVINNEGVIDIKEGRHPVVEKSVLTDERFIPNDTFMDDNTAVQLITGPNMSGKSTYMRQVALITLMAHIGSFVPAKYANISIVDRIFTRIGASDNLTEGESTFMVEMNEVSHIMKNATGKSLIILDEVGRGTSTYDGLSIAWAIVVHLAEKLKSKTLFATHYHDLTELSDTYKNVINKTVLIEEKNNEILFLRKIVNGSTDKSYGIEVAKLAGIQESILMCAKNKLLELEEGHIRVKDQNKSNELFQVDLETIKRNSIIDEIKRLKIEDITPIEAMNILMQIQNRLNSI